MQNKINIGIIGKKFGYNVIYKSFLKNKKYNISGFAFKSTKNNKLKLPKNIKIYSSWKKLILDKKINAVAVATPPVLHKSIIEFAIKKKKHIFCEKPLTCSNKDANYLCNLVKKKKNLAHMVNYEFPEIDAFMFFKRNIMNNIKINKVNINWFISQKKRPQNNWKENHSKGGGIMFNFVCHAIYYLEFLFGKITSTKANISIAKNKKIKTLNGTIFFKNGLSAKLNVKAGLISKKIKTTHELKIVSDKSIYILKTKLNSLSDKFKLLKFSQNSKNKFGKVLFKNKESKNDFRIGPTLKNSKKFSKWILNGKAQKPNFFDSQRIHLIINKMMMSSKKNRKTPIN